MRSLGATSRGGGRAGGGRTDLRASIVGPTSRGGGRASIAGPTSKGGGKSRGKGGGKDKPSPPLGKGRRDADVSRTTITSDFAALGGPRKMDPDLTIHANMALQVPDPGGSATGMRQVVGHSLCTE